MTDSLTNLLARFDSEFKSVCDDLKAIRDEFNFASRSSVRQYGLPAIALIFPLLGFIYDDASVGDYITIFAGFGILIVSVWLMCSNYIKDEGERGYYSFLFEREKLHISARNKGSAINRTDIDSIKDWLIQYSGKNSKLIISEDDAFESIDRDHSKRIRKLSKWMIGLIVVLYTNFLLNLPDWFDLTMTSQSKSWSIWFKLLPEWSQVLSLHYPGVVFPAIALLSTTVGIALMARK